MEIVFHYPEAALLLLPGLLIWWLIGRSGKAAILRLVLLLLAVGALTGPEWVWGRGGSDVLLLFDRSDSMPIEALRAQDEIMQTAARQRGARDRLGVIAFADGVQTVQAPARVGVPRLADIDVPATATDLHAAMEVAAGVSARGRTGRVLVHSDGQVTELNPQSVVAELALQKRIVDVLPVESDPFSDAAISRIEVPGALRLGESFIGQITFLSDNRELRQWRIHRGSTLVAEGRVELLPGEEVTVLFSDRPVAPGLARYVAELSLKLVDDGDDPWSAEGEIADRQPLNNTARAAVRMSGAERILVMSGDGQPGNISTALQAAGLHVDTIPEGAIQMDQLLAYKVLLLDQVPAAKLGYRSMKTIAEWVEHLGGGLVMGGGRRSFGSGGFHRSPLEPVLPVSMELRDEHRKLSVAMAACLDRSGSMSAPVGGGQTKMDLANEGTAAMVELLGPNDSVAVFAVDSSPHDIIPLTPVSDTASLVDSIRRIESRGGGIYVYEALVAGGKELLASNKGTRHLVLFADAADAEQPADYKNLLAEYQKNGITVSVIGLGTEHDSDADFLKDVAKRGGGRVQFSRDPEELPRLFAQETVLVARTSWVDAVVAPQPEPPLVTVVGAQDILKDTWPAIVGYNLVYPRQRADVLALAPGDPQGPAVASWRIGTGRSVAMTMALDQRDNASFLDWEGYVPLLAGLVRWAAGSEDDGFAQLTAERAGRTVRLQLALDPAHRELWPTQAPTAVLASDDTTIQPIPVSMQVVDDGVFEGVVTLQGEEAMIPGASLVRDGKAQAVLGPALQLPYSPEAEPRFDQMSGMNLLERLANLGNGTLRTDLLGLYDNPPSAGERRPMAWALIALALVLLCAEIASRRLQWSLGDLFTSKKRKVPNHSEAPISPKVSAAAVSSAGAESATTVTEAGAGLGKDQGLHEALRQLKKRRQHADDSNDE